MRKEITSYIAPVLHSTKELLHMQTKGQTLTADEKFRVIKYEANKRKQKQFKRK